MAVTWLGESRVCRACGGRFPLTRDAQQVFAARNLSLPRRCPRCSARGRIGPPDAPATTPIGHDTALETGLVMRVNAAQGFGFIRADAGGPTVFVHVCVLPEIGRLEGARVRFTREDTPRGPRATWAEWQHERSARP